MKNYTIYHWYLVLFKYTQQQTTTESNEKKHCCIWWQKKPTKPWSFVTIRKVQQLIFRFWSNSEASKNLLLGWLESIFFLIKICSSFNNTAYTHKMSRKNSFEYNLRLIKYIGKVFHEPDIIFQYVTQRYKIYKYKKNIVKHLLHQALTSYIIWLQWYFSMIGCLKW